MKRLWRNREANLFLIFILVIFALSAWMGALTFTFKKTEELRIAGVDFNADNTIDIHVQNVGTATVTITEAKVDYTIIDVVDITIGPGESYEVTGIHYVWTKETAYDIAVVTSTGNTFIYRAKSPSK